MRIRRKLLELPSFYCGTRACTHLSLNNMLACSNWRWFIPWWKGSKHLYGGGGSSWASAVPLLLSLCFKQKTFKETFWRVFFLDPSEQEKVVFISVEFFSVALFSLQCGASLEMLIYIIKETTGLNWVLNLLFKINQSLCKKKLQAGDDLEVRAGQWCPEKNKLNSVLWGLCASPDKYTARFIFIRKRFLKSKDQKNPFFLLEK